MGRTSPRRARQGDALAGDDPRRVLTAPDPDGGIEEARTWPDPGRRPASTLLELMLRLGATVERVAEASGADPWFIAQINELVNLRNEPPRHPC